jgi:hypothetical protein
MVVVCLPAWPGVFTVDSHAIYRDAIEDQISNWYSPGITWLWGVAEGLGMIPGGAFLTGVFLVACGLWVTYRLWFPAVWTSAFTLGTVLFPPVYGMLGWVGRDIWLAGLVLATIGGLGWAIRLPRWRRPLLGISLVTALVSVDARQNALPTVMLWALVAGSLLIPSGKLKPVLVSLAVIGGLALALGFRSTVNALVVERQLYPFQAVMLRDLAGISLLTRQLYLPTSLNPNQDLDELEQHWATLGPDDRGSWLFGPASPVAVDPWETGEPINSAANRRLEKRRLVRANSVPSNPRRAVPSSDRHNHPTTNGVVRCE